MKRWQSMVSMTAAVIVGTTLVSCTSEGQPNPVADSSSAKPTVDLAALDTGSYPTEPRPEFGVADDKDWNHFVRVEGQRMAQFTVLPVEVDPGLVDAALQLTTPIASGANLDGLIYDGASKIAANNELVSGFSTKAASDDDPKNMRSLQIMVLRYFTPETAQAAAGQLTDGFAEFARQKGADPVVGTLSGVNGAQTVATSLPESNGGGDYLHTFTPHGVYVIFTWASAPSAQQAEAMTRKAIPLQEKLIDQFPRTLTAKERRARGLDPKNLEFPVEDQNKILIYALPHSDEDLNSSDPTAGGKVFINHALRAVYGPRGLAHFTTDSENTFTILKNAGSTANAVERSFVYRAETDEKAQELADAYAKSDGDPVAIAPPPGLTEDQAHCTSIPGVSSTYYQCIVRVGRYVADVHSNNKGDVYQQASAQYLILTKADQNAN